MGSTFDTVRELARALPNVEEGGPTSPSALKVKGKLLAWLREDPTILAVKVSPVDRDYLLQVEPDIFFVTEHYRNYPIVLVRLARIGRRRLAEVLEDAWRQVAPKRMRAAYDAQQLAQTKRRAT
ncbi:MAG: MmcQ/YjbR family DNA-binding protein [Gemmatimonadales bacterium]